MRWTRVVLPLLSVALIVLLAQSPALAKEHVGSPPRPLSMVIIVGWVVLTAASMRLLKGAHGPTAVFAVASVATAIVAGEFVDGIFAYLLNVRLGPVGAFICVCAVNLIAQGAAVVWAGRAQVLSRRVSATEAVKVVLAPAVLSTAVFFALMPMRK